MTEHPYNRYSFKQENTVVRGIAAQVQEQPLDPTEIEIDEFQFNFSATEKPHVQNDTVTLHRKYTTDHTASLMCRAGLGN